MKMLKNLEPRGIFGSIFAILEKCPMAFQIGKSSAVSFKLGNLLLCTSMSFLVNEKQISLFTYYCH